MERRCQSSYDLLDLPKLRFLDCPRPLPNWFLLIVHNLATPHDAFDDNAGRQGGQRKTEVRWMKKNASPTRRS
jgi:hypothetical protein